MKYDTTKIIDIQGLIPEIPPIHSMDECAIYRGHADESWSILPRSQRGDQQHWNPWDRGSASSSTWSHCTTWSDSVFLALSYALIPTEDHADGALWRLAGQLDWVWEEGYDASRFQFVRPLLFGDSHLPLGSLVANYCGGRGEEALMVHPIPEEGIPPIAFENWYCAEDAEDMVLTKIIIPHECKNWIRSQIVALGMAERSREKEIS